MSTCKYCGKSIEWEAGPRGTRPVNPDGTLHHRTCKPYHRMKARQARELKAAYGPGKTAEAWPEIPGQMQFGF